MANFRFVRTCALVGVTTLLTCAAAEVLCGLFYTFETGRLFWTRGRPATASASIPPASREQFNTPYMISPYFGYISRPGATVPDTFEDFAREKLGYIKRPYYADWRINNYGFLA